MRRTLRLLRFGLDIGAMMYLGPDCGVDGAYEREHDPAAFPYRSFSDAKNHKPPTFSRKVGGLCLQNLAVKERFELSIQFPVYTLSRRAP
ncbi:hypothetical protein EMIT0P258_60035 [Pseudomonas sp. IT-P258]